VITLSYILTLARSAVDAAEAVATMRRARRAGARAASCTSTTGARLPFKMRFPARGSISAACCRSYRALVGVLAALMRGAASYGAGE